MFYNAKESNVVVNGSTMDYVFFGRGQKPLVILPGLSDGLKTVKGQAKVLALYYKEFAQKYKVYIFSRKNDLKAGYTIRDMAEDQKLAMEKLGIESAYVMGLSQGGMISQYLAIDFPELVEKLVIVVSVSRQNETVQNNVRRWIEMAKSSNYKALIIDTMENTFTPKLLKKYRPIYPIISRIGKPKNFDRFLIQANACLNHNAYHELERITCPTLVIGGDSDKVVGKNASEDIASKISGSKLIVYKGFGHGLYEETNDFNRRVMDFLIDNA
jgi:pimeloyl-ACP methyl ester carboxylesterase